MRPENAIEIRNISKSFRIYYDKSYLLKERALNWDRNQYEERQVLQDISFDVKRGEVIGVIGANGCGKSTLLKLITGIIYPDSGRIDVAGRVSSLLELGAGFHPDLSGRENIYINCSVFGMSEKETGKRVNEIISFAELENVIDTPVRTYSSGMYMRLAFSTAIHIDADILLIDEILSVGDVRFQAKCMERLLEIKEAGTTIILVSHAESQIRQLCDRCIWLKDGRIKEQGDTAKVYSAYTGKAGEPAVREEEMTGEAAEPEPAMTITKTVLCGPQPLEQAIFRTGDSFTLKLALNVGETDVKTWVLELNLVREDGIFCSGISTPLGKAADENGDLEVCVRFSDVDLLGGKYHFDVNVVDETGQSVFFSGNAAGFQIETDPAARGIMRMHYEWV